MRTCTRCHIKKISWDFPSYINKDGFKKKSSVCDSCTNIKLKTINNNKSNNRKNQLKVNYGLSLEDYNTMFMRQGGKCYICKIHQNKLKRALSVDHCHKTNKVRGLLCNHCNIGLGHFDDNPYLLKRAIKYLEVTQGIIPCRQASKVRKVKSSDV